MNGQILGTDSRSVSEDELERKYHTINENDPPELIEREKFQQAVAKLN